MRLLNRFVLPLTAIMLAACGSTSADSKASKKDAAAPASNEVVASGDGFEIRRDELDKRAHDRLAALRQQEYDVRREVLDDLIQEKLVEKEAKARGISSEALIKSEVDDKIGPVPSAEVDALYERAK